MARGGARKGAGRPHKTDKTTPLRIPERMKTAVLSYVASNGHKVPLYSSSVAAGALSAADDHVEAHLDVNELLIKNPTHTFLVRACGESMKNAGIHTDDLLVVDKSIEPVSGKIVIAAVDGQLTVKRLEKTEHTLRLIPENEAFSPIEITAENDIHILGVVTNVIRAI